MAVNERRKNRSNFKLSAEVAAELVTATAVERILHDTSNLIARKFGAHLAEHNAAYIAPAVWGASLDAPLTEIQIRIYNIIQPAVSRIHTLLDLPKLERKQEHVIEYMIRTMFISNLAFIVEMARSMIEKKLVAERTGHLSLVDMDTIGEA